MKANVRCVSCMINKQKQLIEGFSDEDKKSEYMKRVKNILDTYAETESAPWLAEKIDCEYKNIFGDSDRYAHVKRQYNLFLLRKEKQIESDIRLNADRIKASIQYVAAANYIDFSAVENVNEKTFNLLLEKASREKVDENEYIHFRNDLRKSKTLVYLTDNCGEIVADKIFIKFLKEEYRNLDITVIVRGFNTINDATMEDAKQIGLTKIVKCIGNGNAAPGTVPSRLNEESLSALKNADIIIAKGQGNFEGMYAEGFNPYYLFLCKCELFTERFGLKKFSSVFCKEERIEKIKKF